MKRISWILITIILTGCQTKDCTEWYSGLKLTPVTIENNGNERIGDWYVTDFFENELNFETTFYFSADGYEECKSKTMIHEIIKDSIHISCDRFMVIDNDTLFGYSNLKDYFDITESSGHMLLSYKKQEFNFPLFEQQENTFNLEVTLSDNKILKDSCIVKITQ
jgi:hypothetical protein